MSTPRVAQPPRATSEGRQPGESLLRPEEHVLATLEADGSRRWLFPRLAQGDFWNARPRGGLGTHRLLYHPAALAKCMGKPPVLLDIPTRRFTILGYTFLPTDTLLLALLMVSAFVSIFLVTAMFGRVWCGWGCPQTVYMEFLFRPIDRLFDGTAGKGGCAPRKLTGLKWWARIAVYPSGLCIFNAYVSGLLRGHRSLRRVGLEVPFAAPSAVPGNGRVNRTADVQLHLLSRTDLLDRLPLWTLSISHA